MRGYHLRSSLRSDLARVPRPSSLEGWDSSSYAGGTRSFVLLPSAGPGPLDCARDRQRLGHVQAGLRGQPGPLELDGGMRDVESLRQQPADVLQDLFATLQVHVGDADVAGDGVELGSQRLDVDVVHFLHSG